jgi:hypothetical protein
MNCLNLLVNFVPIQIVMAVLITLNNVLLVLLHFYPNQMAHVEIFLIVLLQKEVMSQITPVKIALKIMIH